jgi:nucleoside-diphosphate-sugar epimerase
VRSVLIAGCGYLGVATARLFLRDGWRVEGWNRSGEVQGAEALELPVRAVDLSKASEVDSAEGEFDFVIHSASTRGGDAADYLRLYRDGLNNLRQRFRGSHLLFVSSTSVYAQKSGEWVDEASPAEPLHEKGRILREAEKIALATGGRVARLAGLYGPGRSAFLRRVLAKDVSLEEGADRYVNQVHRDDAASALLAIAQSGAGGEIWNVADNDPLLLSACYQWLADRLKQPLSDSAKPARPRKRGESNKRVSNSRLRHLGWEPIYPSFREGMERSVLPAL